MRNLCMRFPSVLFRSAWLLIVPILFLLIAAQTAGAAEDPVDAPPAEETPAAAEAAEDPEEVPPEIADTLSAYPWDYPKCEPGEMVDPSTMSAGKRYKRWLRYMEYIAMNKLDMFGATSTVPAGHMIAIFGWGTMRPGGRFSEHRQLEDLIPILEVPDPFNMGGNFFSFDFVVDGRADGYFTGLSYGINDRMMLTLTSMFTVLNIKMDPVFEPGTSERLGVATREEFYQLLEELGRPRPKHSYRSDPVDWGDTTLAFTWNYFRNTWFSTGFTGNLFIPTGHRADPDSALIFGLGPDLDTGAAAWGVGFSKMFDFRPPKPLNVITFSFAGEGAYYFQAKRKSPHFLKPNQDVWDYMTAQGVELDFLPDLSDMDAHYYYTPGPWLAASAGIGAGPVSITYRHGFGFEQHFESNSPGFQKMLDELGLVGTGDDGKVIFAASLPLTPLFIPAIAQFRTEYVTDGKNNIVFRDIYQVGLGFIIPINPPKKYTPPKDFCAPGYGEMLGLSK